MSSARCSIILVDADMCLRHGAAPSLPDAYTSAIDGVKCGPAVGSCGTAVHERRRVVVADIASHPYWVNFKELALAHGLRACWSDCILDRTGRALGSFAVYYGQPREPMPLDYEMIDNLKDLSAIAIERHLAEDRQAKLVEDLREQHRIADEVSRRLRESEIRFRDFTEISADWYWEQDEDLRFTFVSDSNESTSGLNLGHHYGKTRRETNPIGVSDEQWRQHEAVLAARQPFRDFRFHRIDGRGRIRCLSVNGLPVFDKVSGAFKGYRGTGRDITNQVEAEQALRAVIEAMPAMVNAKDTQSRYILMNSYQARLYGTTPEAAVGRTAAELLDADYGAYTRAIDQRVIDAGEPSGLYEETYADAEGTVRSWLTAKQPLKDGRGVVKFVITVAMDITRRKQAEERLMESQRALSAAMLQVQAASEAKSNILANLSHELRTPLNAIIGFSEIMASELMGPLGSKRYLEYAGDVLRSGRYLHDLIGDLLDMARTDAGQRKLDLEKIDPVKELHETLRMMQVRAEQNGVTLEADLGRAPSAIVADRRALRQIVLNLVGNAVKFTPTGGRVAVRMIGADGGWRLEVRDSGIGIAPDKIARLGTPFFRVEGPQASTTVGTGLGLAICKSLVELHGWTIGFGSQPGEGTVVTVEMRAGVSARGACS